MFFRWFTTNCGGSRIVTYARNVLTIPCKALPWFTRPICVWRNKERVVSRTVNISWLSVRS